MYKILPTVTQILNVNDIIGIMTVLIGLFLNEIKEFYGLNLSIFGISVICSDKL